MLDSEHNGVRKFVMPPMAGFIEFALMRTRGDIDQKYLSELYYQHMNVEEDFVKDLFILRHRDQTGTCLCAGAGADQHPDEPYPGL